MRRFKVIISVFCLHIICFCYFSKDRLVNKTLQIQTIEIKPMPIIKKTVPKKIVKKEVKKSPQKKVIKKIVKKNPERPSSLDILKKNIFQNRFILEMSSFLSLPEYGEVKMKIIVSSFGKIIKTDILFSKSKKNELYLKNILPTLSFPWLNQFISKNAEFVISFKNEE